jgi:hypothetical protein
MLLGKRRGRIRPATRLHGLFCFGLRMGFIRQRNLFLDSALAPRGMLGSHRYLLAIEKGSETLDCQSGKIRTAATLAGELKKERGLADATPWTSGMRRAEK